MGRLCSSLYFYPEVWVCPWTFFFSTFHDINILYSSECDFIIYSLNLKEFLFINLFHTCLLSKFWNLLEFNDSFVIVLHLWINLDETNFQSNTVSFFSSLIMDSFFFNFGVLGCITSCLSLHLHRFYLFLSIMMIVHPLLTQFSSWLLFWTSKLSTTVLSLHVRGDVSIPRGSGGTFHRRSSPSFGHLFNFCSLSLYAVLYINCWNLYLLVSLCLLELKGFFKKDLFIVLCI